MKKLMFMLACVAGLSVAHAGAVAWSAWDDSGSGTSDLAFYLFEGDLTTGSTIDAITDAASAATYVAGAADSGALDHTDGFYGEGSITGLAAGSKSYYAVVFNSDDVSTATGYKVIGNYVVTVPGNGSIGLDMDLNGLTSSGYTSIGGGSTPDPSGVPEPTSGLLLLVGGAMLALRRRRA